MRGQKEEHVKQKGDEVSLQAVKKKSKKKSGVLLVMMRASKHWMGAQTKMHACRGSVLNIWQKRQQCR